MVFYALIILSIKLLINYLKNHCIQLGHLPYFKSFQWYLNERTNYQLNHYLYWIIMFQNLFIS